MNIHLRIQKQLYDYLHQALDPHERVEVDDHLKECAKCMMELEEVKIFLAVTEATPIASNGERSVEFWKNFAIKVENRIRTANKGNIKIPISTWDIIWAFLVLRKRSVFVYAGTCIALIVVLFLWKDAPPTQIEENVEPLSPTTMQLSNMDQRMEKYFRKSKVLLVGVANMDLDKSRSVDLSIEKKVSRELVNEARYIQRQPIDIRSARLLNDLEKIQIELANIGEQNAIPRMEVVRNGIRKNNLLFKVRMAESVYHTAGLIDVNKTGEKK